MKRLAPMLLTVLLVPASAVLAESCVEGGDCPADASAAVSDGVTGSEPAPTAAAAPVDPAAGYQKKTEFDNTPYRFNAEKGFTAEEFDAWMKARGIRIATGKPAAAPTAGEAVAASATEVSDTAVAAAPVVETATTEAAASTATAEAVATAPATPARPASAATTGARAPVATPCATGAAAATC